jgi:hypothetical protein
MGVRSEHHLRSRSKASSGDMFIFRQYVKEFGDERARYYAVEHGLNIGL